MYSSNNDCLQQTHDLIDILDSVWENVFIKQPLALSLDSSVLRSLHQSFDHYHASAVRAVQMLKQALAHSCTKRGKSTLYDMNRMLTFRFAQCCVLFG